LENLRQFTFSETSKHKQHQEAQLPLTKPGVSFVFVSS